MTTEQAIKLLHRLQDEQFDGIHGDERREALEMAVRALEGDGDMISRKAVMKEFSNFVRRSNNSDFAPTPTWNDAVSLVGSMPSAQPETLACGSGELVQESDGLVKELVKDCISRQQAIDALDKHIDTFDAIDTNYLCGLRTAMSILKEMPSAQPETHEKRTETHACDLISREVAIDAVNEYLRLSEVSKTVQNMTSIQAVLRWLPSAQPEIIRCKDCNKASKCYGDVLMRSRGGGYIYCPLEFCSKAERRTDEN